MSDIKCLCNDTTLILFKMIFQWTFQVDNAKSIVHFKKGMLFSGLNRTENFSLKAPAKSCKIFLISTEGFKKTTKGLCQYASILIYQIPFGQFFLILMNYDRFGQFTHILLNYDRF